MNHESGPLLPRLKDDKVQGVLPHVYQKTHELRVGHGAPADLELLLVRAGAHDFQCVFIKGVVVLRKKAVTIGCAILMIERAPWRRADHDWLRREPVRLPLPVVPSAPHDAFCFLLCLCVREKTAWLCSPPPTFIYRHKKECRRETKKRNAF